MNNKKKLVHIISSLKQGGAESLLVDLIRNLDDFEHHVIYFHDGPNRISLQALGIATYHIRGFLCLYDPLFWVRLGVLVHRLKPNCIHSSLWAANFSARILARIVRIPLVSVIHLGVHQDGKIRSMQEGKLRSMVDWATFALSKQIVTVSQEIADTLKECAWVPAERIQVITNGIDIQAVCQEAHQNRVSKKDIGFDDDALIVGCVGRFIVQKNHCLLIRSFAKSTADIKNARLVLIGFGPTEHSLRVLVDELGISHKVRFEIGKKAYGYYPLFDCFVLSSYQEGISIALLEAMCFSLPCIVTSPTKSHEVITSGYNGLIIPSNNESMLTESLRSLLQDSVVRQKLGIAAFDTVNTAFNIQTMVKKYRKLFTT